MWGVACSYHCFNINAVYFNRMAIVLSRGRRQFPTRWMQENDYIRHAVGATFVWRIQLGWFSGWTYSFITMTSSWIPCIIHQIYIYIYIYLIALVKKRKCLSMSINADCFNTKFPQRVRYCPERIYASTDSLINWFSFFPFVNLKSGATYALSCFFSSTSSSQGGGLFHWRKSPKSP